MISNVLEPGLIQGHGVVSGSRLLCQEYRSRGPGTCHRDCLLIVRQDLWQASEMALHKPELLSESTRYPGFWEMYCT
jgi:hypothetical protein